MENKVGNKICILCKNIVYHEGIDPTCKVLNGRLHIMNRWHNCALWIDKDAKDEVKEIKTEEIKTESVVETIDIPDPEEKSFVDEADEFINQGKLTEEELKKRRVARRRAKAKRAKDGNN